jgi:hypothetical protein
LSRLLEEEISARNKKKWKAHEPVHNHLGLPVKRRQNLDAQTSTEVLGEPRNKNGLSTQPLLQQ